VEGNAWAEREVVALERLLYQGYALPATCVCTLTMVSCHFASAGDGQEPEQERLDSQWGARRATFAVSPHPLFNACIGHHASLFVRSW
jgi:hypothetical protein